MRPTCTYCARKHLAQAAILVGEARMGYPEHLWLAVGHMAEAAEELIGTYPDMANLIRMHRKQLEMPVTTGGVTTYAVPFMELIAEVGKLGAANAYPIMMVPSTGRISELPIEAGDDVSVVITPQASQPPAFIGAPQFTPSAAELAWALNHENAPYPAALNIVPLAESVVVGRTSQVDQFAPKPPEMDVIKLTPEQVAERLGAMINPAPPVAPPTIGIGAPAHSFPSSAAPQPAPGALTEAEKEANLQALITESMLLPKPHEPGHKEAVDAFQKKAQAMSRAGMLASIVKKVTPAPGAYNAPAPGTASTPAGPCLTCDDRNQLTKVAMSLIVEDNTARLAANPPGPLDHTKYMKGATHGEMFGTDLRSGRPLSELDPTAMLDRAAERSSPAGSPRGPGPKPRLMILTTLADFNPSYSLTSVVLEQAHAAVLVGYRVFLLVHRGANMSQCPPLPPEITVLTVVPVTAWKEDVIDEEAVQMYVAAMNEWFQVLAPKEGHLRVVTHDLLFQAWFVSFSKAIHEIDRLRKGAPPRPYLNRIRWYHTAHSSVGARPTELSPFVTLPPGTSARGASGQWAVPATWYRCTLPRDHELLALNYADVPHLQEYYRRSVNIDENQVLPEGTIITLLNPRDVRPFLRMTSTASMLTTRYGLHLADVTMIYPLSLMRVQEKGVDKVLAVLGALKKMGLTVRLLLITAHANGDKAPPIVARIKEQANAHGLMVDGQEVDAFRGKPGERVYEVAVVGAGELAPDVILTCDALPNTAGPGLDADTVRSLWQVSNLFVFPTISEAGSLVLMEAALAGCTLVLNQSLPALADYIPADLAIWVPWGSLKGPGQVVDYRELADQVWDRIRADGSTCLRRVMFRNHCLETYGAALKAILEPTPIEADQDMDDHTAVMNRNVVLNVAASAAEQVQRVADNFANERAQLGPHPDPWEGARELLRQADDAARKSLVASGELPPGWNEEHPPAPGDAP